MATPAPARQSVRRAAALGFALDLVVLAIFIALGRRTHEGTGLPGFAQTLWPFLVALVLAWAGVLTSRRGNDPESHDPGGNVPDAAEFGAILRLWPVGYVIWFVTAFGGLTLRALAGGGVSGMFPFVAVLTIGAGFILWRLAGALLRRRTNG